jgi:hypothetical protein
MSKIQIKMYLEIWTQYFFGLSFMSHKYIRCHFATFQLNWWNNTSVAPPCIISGTSGGTWVEAPCSVSKLNNVLQWKNQSHFSFNTSYKMHLTSSLLGLTKRKHPWLFINQKFYVFSVSAKLFSWDKLS